MAPIGPDARIPSTMARLEFAVPIQAVFHSIDEKTLGGRREAPAIPINEAITRRHQTMGHRRQCAEAGLFVQRKIWTQIHRKFNGSIGIVVQTATGSWDPKPPISVAGIDDACRAVLTEIMQL
jgi:hypothetical protein